jgi:hypothetical protein
MPIKCDDPTGDQFDSLEDMQELLYIKARSIFVYGIFRLLNAPQPLSLADLIQTPG